jgi:CubicO group peptidase (beta-lactamase class C family)
MKLFENKKFKLDDDISDKLGFSLRHPKYPNDKITYRMILSHTGSLGQGSKYGDFLHDTTIATNVFPTV